MILVAGSMGHLGSRVVEEASSQGLPIRALVRPHRANEWSKPNIPFTIGDLLDPLSLDRACDGIDQVIATATAHIPTRTGDDFVRTEEHGYQNLITACRRRGVRRLMFISGLRTPLDEFVPLCRIKRNIERRIEESGISYLIFRAPGFMDVAFALLGSDIPIAGCDRATINRPFWFTRRHFDRIRHSIRRDGVAFVPGDGKRRESFICVDDVSRFLVAAVRMPYVNRTVDIGGPATLSFRDVVAIYSHLLGKAVRIRTTPAILLKALSYALRPISAEAANVMALNYLFATVDAVVPE